MNPVCQQATDQRSPAIEQRKGRALQQAELDIADTHLALDGVHEHRGHIAMHEGKRGRHQHHQQEGLGQSRTRPWRLGGALPQQGSA